MADSKKEVLLVGFGAVGGIYSLILQKSGKVNLTVVARSNYESVNNEGVHFKSEKFGDVQGWRPRRLVNSVKAAADRAYSHVFIAAKCVPEVVSNSQLVAPLLSDAYASSYPQPTYVLLQNGWNFERELYDSVKGLGKGEPRIVSSALYIMTNLHGPNVIWHNAVERVVLGMYRCDDYGTTMNSPEEQAVLDELEEILKAGGSTVEVVPEIQRRKYAKNMLNVTFAGFSCLTRYPLMSVFRPPPSEPIQYSTYVHPITADRVEEFAIPAMRGVMQELVNLAYALGFPDSAVDGIPSSCVVDAVEHARNTHNDASATHVASTLLDIEKGYPIEVEVIWGGIVRAARERQVDMPRTEMMYSILVVVENQLIRERALGPSK